MKARLRSVKVRVANVKGGMKSHDTSAQLRC